MSSATEGRALRANLEDPNYPDTGAHMEFMDFHNRRGFGYQKSSAWLVSATTGNHRLVVEYILLK